MIIAEEAPTRVLVVDDEEDLELLVRQKFRRRIRNKELEFLFAHNGKEALEVLGQNPDVQLVLSDINMPVMGRPHHAQSTVQNQFGCAGGSGFGLWRYGQYSYRHESGRVRLFDQTHDFNDLEITIDKGIRQVHIQKAAVVARDRLVIVNRELELASEVQMSTRPRDMPSKENHQVSAVIIPAGKSAETFMIISPSTIQAWHCVSPMCPARSPGSPVHHGDQGPAQGGGERL